MKEQNIYDNSAFFEDYIDHRNKENSLNELIEQPEMSKNLPNLKGLKILDLGCGYGKNSIEFMKKGAKSCLAIDISKNMIDCAQKSNPYKNLSFKIMGMDDLHEINEKFDFIYSSLAFHYIEDWDSLFKNISRLLKKNGFLLFSTGNPIRVGDAFPNGWVKNENGEPVGFNISNYGIEGKRIAKWWGQHDVELYHHTYSTLLNCLTKYNLHITYSCEPQGDDKMIELNASLTKMKIVPSYLIIKAIKL